MSLASRVARLEQRAPTTAPTGPYRPEDKPPFDYAGFAALVEDWDREHPAHWVLRQQTVAEYGDDTEE